MHLRPTPFSFSRIVPDGAARAALGRGLLIAALALLAGCGSGETNPPPSNEEPTVSASPVILAVGVSDRTDARPPSPDLQIQAPEGEPWQPNLSFGGTSQAFGEYEVGEERILTVYPRGTGGPAVQIPFTMRADMISGTAESKTYIYIYDDSIAARGKALPDGHVTRDRPAP